MTSLEKRFNLGAVIIPFAAFLAAVVLLWNSAVSINDLVILAVMYVITGLGITVGFHRMLTHRSFVVPKPLEYGFAILGSMAVQGPVMAWVADHRKHHAHADEEGDPQARTSATATVPPACSAAYGTRTPAGCSPIRGGRTRASTPRISSRTAA